MQIAHQDAQGDHFPEPGAADVCVYGARLACTPGVQVLTGPVIGEVTLNSVVSNQVYCFFTGGLLLRVDQALCKTRLPCTACCKRTAGSVA